MKPGVYEYKCISVPFEMLQQIVSDIYYQERSEDGDEWYEDVEVIESRGNVEFRPFNCNLDLSDIYNDIASYFKIGRIECFLLGWGIGGRVVWIIYN